MDRALWYPCLCSLELLRNAHSRLSFQVEGPTAKCVCALCTAHTKELCPDHTCWDLGTLAHGVLGADCHIGQGANMIIILRVCYKGSSAKTNTLINTTLFFLRDFEMS